MHTRECHGVHAGVWGKSAGVGSFHHVGCGDQTQVRQAWWQAPLTGWVILLFPHMVSLLCRGRRWLVLRSAERWDTRALCREWELSCGSQSSSSSTSELSSSPRTSGPDWHAHKVRNGANQGRALRSHSLTKSQRYCLHPPCFLLMLLQLMFSNKKVCIMYIYFSSSF